MPVAMPELVQRYAASHLLDADVYEVDHHGSKNGVSDDLLSAITPKIAIISMGSTARHEMWTAWQYGHPNKGTVELVESHVSETRTAIQEPLGSGSKNFSNENIHAAVYATGWDGTVVIDAHADGTLKILK